MGAVNNSNKVWHVLIFWTSWCTWVQSTMATRRIKLTTHTVLHGLVEQIQGVDFLAIIADECIDSSSKKQIIFLPYTFRHV